MTERSPKVPETVVFEPEYLEGVRDIFERKIVFNQTLGLKITDIQPSVVLATIQISPPLPVIQDKHLSYWVDVMRDQAMLKGPMTVTGNAANNMKITGGTVVVYGLAYRL